MGLNEQTFAQVGLCLLFLLIRIIPPTEQRGDTTYPTLYMEDECSQTHDLSSDTKRYGIIRLTHNSRHRTPIVCSLYIHARSGESIMVNVSKIDMGEYNCASRYLYVHDGVTSLSGRICDFSALGKVYVVRSGVINLYFRYVRQGQVLL